MREDEWLEREPLCQLLRELTDDVVTRYRISRSDAEQIVADSVVSNEQLKHAASENSTAARLKRTRVYKKAASDAKRNVYYFLRTYRTDDARLAGLIDTLTQLTRDSPASHCEQAIHSILESHVSTRERLAHQHEFYQQLGAAVSPPRYVLDVGCGVHPLMFPFNSPWSQHLVQYLAVDENSRDVASVDAFGKLQQEAELIAALQWSVADGWPKVMDHAGCTTFDLALIMKLVPVIHRQRRDLLPVLCATPATAWLLTGSRVSLTKHVSIERRERRVMEEFVRLAGREVRQEFAVGEEFAWLVVKPEQS